jgi:hypothetical protein
MPELERKHKYIVDTALVIIGRAKQITELKSHHSDKFIYKENASTALALAYDINTSAKALIEYLENELKQFK